MGHFFFIFIQGNGLNNHLLIYFLFTVIVFFFLFHHCLKTIGWQIEYHICIHIYYSHIRTYTSIIINLGCSLYADATYTPISKTFLLIFGWCGLYTDAAYTPEIMVNMITKKANKNIFENGFLPKSFLSYHFAFVFRKLVDVFFKIDLPFIVNPIAYIFVYIVFYIVRRKAKSMTCQNWSQNTCYIEFSKIPDHVVAYFVTEVILSF